ncbi:type II secretion system protein, partial [Clostridium saudiense]|nr:type II secretion system protein [Clostridium saudiense]
MKLNKKKKGFTLIELMAVIAIVAILAAVLVPTVNGYITRSKKTAIVTQARTIMNAIETYNITGGAIIDYKSADAEKTVNALFASGGEFADEELVKKEDVKKILKATLDEVKTINENKTQDILNKIKLADDTTSYGQDENSQPNETIK